MSQDRFWPVIAIDGGAGTGKGTTRILVAKELGFNSLDSGALYRLVTLAGIRQKASHEVDLAKIAVNLDVVFDGEKVFLDDEDVTLEIRLPEIDALVSNVSKMPLVRSGLLQFQDSMRKCPGLVADGRDMCLIYEDTPYKFFLVTDPRERARRRVLQFKERKVTIDEDTVLREILTRDEADRTRKVNPLVPHKDALIIDNTRIPKEEVARIILEKFRGK